MTRTKKPRCGRASTRPRRQQLVVGADHRRRAHRVAAGALAHRRQAGARGEQALADQLGVAPGELLGEGGVGAARQRHGGLGRRPARLRGGAACRWGQRYSGSNHLPKCTGRVSIAGPTLARNSAMTVSSSSARRHETQGLALGLLGVVIFSMTLPMTRLAVGPALDPQLPPFFVTAGRAALRRPAGGGLPAARRARPGPRREHRLAIAVSALGTVVGFPLLLSLALRQVDAMHAAVITGVLPLATALAAAIAFRQRPSAGFWSCAVLGCGLVVGFAAWKGSGSLVAGRPAAARLGRLRRDRLRRRRAALGDDAGRAGDLLGAGVQPAADAAGGAAVDADAAGAAPRPGAASPTSRVFSMWLGFFAWYRGLALGGTVRVSQVQLVQPFLSMLFAVPVLGERLDAATLGFSLAVSPPSSSAGRCRSAGRPLRRSPAPSRRGPHEPQPLAPGGAHRADEPLGDPRDPEAHRAARASSRSPAACRRPTPFRSRRCARRPRASCATTPREALQYAASEGYAPLREWVAERDARRTASRVDASQVLITTGSQQGLDLVGKVLIDAGSRVAVESPTYLGALQAFAPYEPEFVGDRLRRRRAAARGPGRARPRRALPVRAAELPESERPLASARRAGRRSSPRAARSACRSSRTTPTATSGSTPSRRRRSPRAGAEGTIYLGRFSKVLAPGLRLGYVIAPPALVPEAAAGQAGGRPAHAGLQPARGARGDQGRLPARARADDPRAATRRSATRCRRRSRANLPQAGRGLPLAGAGRRHVLLGRAAEGRRRRGAAAARGRARRRLRAGRAVLCRRADEEHPAPVVRDGRARGRSSAACAPSRAALETMP